MFPDFLKVKEKLQKMYPYKVAEARSSHMGALTEGSRRIFEGNKIIVIREDGSIEESNLKKTTVKLQVRPADVETMTLEMTLHKTNEVIEEMAETEAKSVYEQIIKSVNEVGNIVSGDGKPFSMDLFFETLEKISIDFDKAGNPEPLTPVVNSDLWPSVEKVLSQAKADPEDDKRYKEIIERKREEWRARESNRKLVG